MYSIYRFKKAFKSLMTLAVITSVANPRSDKRYIDLIKHLYTNSTIKAHSTKGVGWKDIISTTLFDLVLEDVFKKIKWEPKIMKHGENN